MSQGEAPSGSAGSRGIDDEHSECSVAIVPSADTTARPLKLNVSDESAHGLRRIMADENADVSAPKKAKDLLNVPAF